MVSSPRLRKVTKKTTFGMRRLWIVVIVFVIAMLSIALWLCRNTSFYFVNPTEAKTRMASLLDKIQPASGKLLYSGVVDQGCDDSSSVGLSKRVSCMLVGYKYYQSRDDVKQSLSAIDTMLTQNNWEVLSSSVARRKSVLNGAEGSVTYRTASIPKAGVSLDLYNGANLQSATKIQELIREKKIKAPEDEGRIFGVRVSQIYWSCREDYLYQLPCPWPPSELKK